MIPKRLSNLFFAVGFLLVFSFMFIPDIGYAQAGCCITNGGQCSPGCGSIGDSCQIDEEGNQCAIFVEGEFCFQVDNNVSECQPLGCCELPDGTFIETTEGSCEFPLPDGNGGTYLNDGPCMPPPPSGCCETLDPTECNVTTSEECNNGTFTLGASCSTPTSCGEPPPPIFGCCQTSDTTCDNRENVECPNDPFFPGGMCMVGEISFCNPPPTGCCVIEQGVCSVTTAEECNSQDGDYQGDDTDCAGNPLCEEPIIINSVPTLSQWGLIAMAGMLGIFSLIILMRRRKYKLS